MRGLTKNLRRRAAIVIAVVYAFCVAAPAAALAVVATPSMSHCIGGMNGNAVPAAQKTAAHIHEGGAAHHHGQSVAHQQDGHDHSAADRHADAGGTANDKSEHSGTCCGLFCVSAMAHDPGLTFGVSTPASSTVTAMANGLTGHAPSPLHRPPKA